MPIRGLAWQLVGDFTVNWAMEILTPLIVRNLAIQYPNSPLNSGPLLIYLTARSSVPGEEAVKTLLLDPQLKATKALKGDGGLTTITFHSLDITDEDSIYSFKDLIMTEHPDGIDVLVNNAGIFMGGFGKILNLAFLSFMAQKMLI